MNNPFQILRATRNPAVLMDMMMQGPAQQDARVKKVCDMYRAHDAKGMEQMARNLCQEYGTTPEQVRQNLGGII